MIRKNKKVVGGNGKQAVSGGNCGTFKFIVVALLSYTMGYFHGSAQNLSITGSVGTEKKWSHNDDLMIPPFVKKPLKEYLPNRQTDGYNYFHRYVEIFSRDALDSPKDMDDLPMLHIWPTYFEAYQNHWQRFRGKDEVVFMEIGVQSGGKIPMLRDYFGPGFVYVGIDINDGCKHFDNGDWVHIEIGDSQDPEFMEYIKKKHPKVDLFLDDGGHTMDQQRFLLRELLPHVQPNGVYICEDLSTSWGKKHGSMPFRDSRDLAFLNGTMYGLVHRTIDWLNSGWIAGKVMKEDPTALIDKDFFGKDESMWKEFQQTVQSIHVYSQIVVYEKGHVNVGFTTRTVGARIPYSNTKNIVYDKTDWNNVLLKVQSYTNSHW